jgi:hypothetical protein
MNIIHAILHWLAEWTGTNSTYDTFSTHVYNFVSGFGSDLGEVALIGGVYHLFAVSRCHQGGEGFRGCRKHGKYDFFDPTTNTTYKLCSKHHPSAHKHLSLARIAEIHKKKHSDNYER